MRVDGSTPADAVRADRPPQLHRSGQADRFAPADQTLLTAQEARLSSAATVKAATRVTQDLRDTFRRSGAPTVSRAGDYTPSAEGAREPRVISGAFDGVRATVGEAPRAEIADLKTTANARGLPLISEPYDDGPLFNALVDDFSEPVPEGEPPGLDRLG